MTIRTSYSEDTFTTSEQTAYLWLPTEQQIFGSAITVAYNSDNHAQGEQYTSGYKLTQLPLYRLCPELIYKYNNTTGYCECGWLHNAKSGNLFASMTGYTGVVYQGGRDGNYWVNPIFVLG